MRKNKVSYRIMGAFIIASSMVGISYAKWSETVQISSSIRTGEVKIEKALLTIDDTDITYTIENVGDTALQCIGYEVLVGNRVHTLQEETITINMLDNVLPVNSDAILTINSEPIRELIDQSGGEVLELVLYFNQVKPNSYHLFSTSIDSMNEDQIIGWYESIRFICEMTENGLIIDDSTIVTVPQDILIDIPKGPQLIETPDHVQKPEAPSEIPDHVQKPEVPSETPDNVQKPEVPSETPDNVQKPEVPSEIPDNVQKPEVPSEIPDNVQKPEVPSETPDNVQKPEVPSETPDNVQKPEVPSEIPDNVQKPEVPEVPSDGEGIEIVEPEAPAEEESTNVTEVETLEEVEDTTPIQESEIQEVEDSAGDSTIEVIE